MPQSKPTEATGDPLKIRARRTISEGGDERTEENVYCPRREGAVAVEECLNCADGAGVMTDGDASYFYCRHASAAEVPTGPAVRRRRRPSVADQTPLAAIMSDDVVCVRPDLAVQALATLFVDRGITGAPVVDATGRPIGVVSKSDLVREGTERVGATVADIMMPIAFTLPENASMSHAAALMAYEGVHRVPVVTSDGTVVGIVSTMDVVRWVAQQDGYVLPRARRST